MKIVIPILVFAGTAVLVMIALLTPGASGWSIGEGTGPSFTTSMSGGGTAPEQAVASLLENVQRRRWQAAHDRLANATQVDEAAFHRDLAGSDGGLRTSSMLVGWDLHPLHASDSEAEVRTILHWSTPVGSELTTRDLKVIHESSAWRVVWPKPRFPEIPGQVVPVTYLRWDVVSPRGGDEEWGNRGVDGPRARIVSMNATSYQGGTVIMGEAINEDTVPAFVNVNATLVGGDGKTVGDESSFDKILHVLLPKQVTPYRIDFPDVDLATVKNVRMDIKTSLVPASADPVIGVMNQTIATDAAGRKVLQGQLLNQSGQIVNIPHVIATFYDNQGKVIWVSDGYVDRVLYPETPEAFSVEVPPTIASCAQNYHVVVNQFTLGQS